MDGNTWRRYRFIAERGSEPPFFLEPDNPDAWREQFERAGFRVMATYTSALTGDLTQEDPRVDTTAAKLRSEGVTIRPFDVANAEAELRELFRLSLESFRANYLYSPIDEAEFLDQNRRALPFVVPDLVLMAERGRRLVGFAFALPDVLQRQRRNAVDTVIIKTVAVSPTMANHGLGGLLVGLVQRKAREQGFRRAIHALMHEQNVSQQISRRYAHTIRRYALYVRRFPRSVPT
jgi:L-amino acid N-acyltransferase YncA